MLLGGALVFPSWMKETKILLKVHRDSFLHVSLGLMMAAEMEVLPRLLASEINTQRLLQDVGDTNDAFYWRDKRRLEAELEKFEELSSC